MIYSLIRDWLAPHIGFVQADQPLADFKGQACPPVPVLKVRDIALRRNRPAGYLFLSEPSLPKIRNDGFPVHRHRISHRRSTINRQSVFKKYHNCDMSTFADRVREARVAKGLTQKGLASASGLSQTTISDIERGRNSSSADIVSLSRALGVSAEWLADGKPAKEEFPRTPSADEYALIPQYSAKGGCGPAYLNAHVEVNGGLAFKRNWLSRLQLNPANLSVIYADGDSMAPRIQSGDVLLIDDSKLEPKDGGIFALRRAGGEVAIKRLIKDYSGNWIIRSDNTDKNRYPDFTVTNESITIIGQVVWGGGAL